MSQPYGDQNAYERETGQNELWHRSHWTQKLSTFGVNTSGEGRAVAFAVAQPVWMTWGFLISSVVVGLIMLIALIANKWDNWHSEPAFRAIIALTPICTFLATWFIQSVFSNPRKDNTYNSLIENYAKTVQCTTSTNRN